MWFEVNDRTARSFIIGVISWNCFNVVFLGLFSRYMGKTKSIVCRCFRRIFFLPSICFCYKYRSSHFTTIPCRSNVKRKTFSRFVHASNKWSWFPYYFFVLLIRLAGAQAGAYSYISEFHTTKTAARAVAYSTICLNGLAIPMAIMAILIIPMNWTWHIFQLDFRPWRLFLICNSLINLWNGIVFSLLPESPKFLLTINKKEEALQVLRRVYAFNTGQSEEVNCSRKTLMYSQNVFKSLFTWNLIVELPSKKY